jgi:3-keto-5-aminohexanoate cleavage enzyme
MTISKDKVLVTCALTGVVTKREQCPYIPYSPVEIAEEARRAYEAGAAVVHIHGRDPQSGEATWSADIYQQIKDEVRKRCPILINFSTGGFTMGVKSEDEKRARIEYVRKVKPDIAALNMGTMNYAKYSEKRKGFVFDFIFPNTFGDIAMVAGYMKEGNVNPELECFDVGHIYNIEPLVRMGVLKPPFQISFVLGVVGGSPGKVDTLAHMARQVSPEDQWEVIGIAKEQWRLVASALTLGGNIRVGLEDNFYLDAAGTEMAKGNGPLVEKAVRLARDIGREPMTVDEAKQALRIGKVWG